MRCLSSYLLSSRLTLAVACATGLAWPWQRAAASELPTDATAAAPPAPATRAAGGPVGTKLAWRSGGAPRLLWTGFRAQADGGEVLIQTSGSVDLESHPGGDGKTRGVFVLKHCKGGRRTDRLPLDTRFFRSTVTGVEVRTRGPDLEIAVALREAVPATVHKEAGPAGSWFWVLSFPAAASSGATPTTTAAATTTAIAPR